MKTRQWLQMVLILALVILGSASSKAAGVQSELTVFFIHGLQGDAKTFCDFPEALKEQVQPYIGRSQFRTKVLEYDTNLNQEFFQSQSGKKSTKIFMHEINRKIALYFKQNNLSIDSPYALIMHSQGGLVGTRFVQRCIWDSMMAENDLCNGKDPKDPNSENLPTPKNITDFITIGSPLHGSPGANLIIQGIFNFGREFGLDLLKFSGAPNQTADLSIGSTNLYEERMFLLQNATAQGWKTPYRGKNKSGEEISLDFNYISAVANVELGGLGLLAQMAVSPFINSQSEADLAVDTTSARRDFNYFIMNDENTHPSKALQGQTQLSQQGHYILMDLVHTYEPPLIRFKEDQKCVRIGEPHPSLDIAKRVMLSRFGVDINRVEPMATVPDMKLRNYLSELNIFFPEALKRGPIEDQIKVRVFKNANGDVDKAYVKSSLLIKASDFNNHEDEIATPAILRNRLSFFHQGAMKAEKGLSTRNGMIQGQYEGARVNYEISHPGFETLKVSVPVTASMTTFSKLYLKPYRPLKAQPLPENLDLLMMDMDLLNQLSSPKACYVGIMAPTYPKGRPVKSYIYPMFRGMVDKKEHKHPKRVRNYQKDETRKIRVLGRYQWGSMDRYLVVREPINAAAPWSQHTLLRVRKGRWKKRGRAKKLQIGWMDINEVDVLQNETCPNQE